MFQKNKLKILQVVPILAYGGVEKIVVNYYNNLNHDEYEFDFISHGKSSPYVEQLKSDGCNIYEVETIGALGYIGYKKQVAKIIDINKYDVIHIHIGHITGIYAKVFRDLGAKKIICHAHTTKCVNTKHRVFMPVFRWFANNYSDHRLSCSIMAGDFCFGKRKYELLNNAIDYRKFENVGEGDVNSLKCELGLQTTPFVIGHIGHFSKPKNHPYVVKIIEKYHSVYPDAKFVLVGDGPDRQIIEKEIQGKSLEDFVIFTGIRQDIPVFMKMFDVFILPSLHEGLPVVSIEAQSSGTDCILSDKIDFSSDIGLGLTHFLALKKSCDEWINMIESIRKQGRKSIDSLRIHKALVDSGYDVAATAEHLEQIYRRIVEDNENGV